MFLFLFRMSGLGGFWSGRGLDKIWVVRRWRVVFRSLEHRDCEIRGKATANAEDAEDAKGREGKQATAKTLTQRGRRLRGGRGGA